jgi:3-hydroxyisobutyrate dehydrogenase-like beta-hydroxyacid dehydrogenase
MSAAVIGIVSPGAMGSALGRVWQGGGHRVVATVAGRSSRTASLADGLELLADLDAVVAASDLVVSVCPPAAAREVLTRIIEAAARTRSRPLLADLNAVSPMLAESLAGLAAEAGLELVDGSISGAPPTPAEPTVIYLSGPCCEEVAVLDGEGVIPRIAGDRVGQASAVKMCTASVYKGTTALWAQSLQTAQALGVLDLVLADLSEEFPELAGTAGQLIALGASKSHRYVAEMEQISATQGAVGASPELFEAMAAVYRRLAATPLAGLTPEEARGLSDLSDVLRRLG